MAVPDSKTVALAGELRKRLAAVRLTPAQAKLYSQNVRRRLGRPGLSSFGPADVGDRVDEARLLLCAALAERDAEPSGDWRHSVKRAGELLEWIAHGRTVDDGFPAAILAAGAYQLAGFPALAHGLLAVIDTDA